MAALSSLFQTSLFFLIVILPLGLGKSILTGSRRLGFCISLLSPQQTLTHHAVLGYTGISKMQVLFHTLLAPAIGGLPVLVFSIRCASDPPQLLKMPTAL